MWIFIFFFFDIFFFQAEDGIRDIGVTGVQTCALPICNLLSQETKQRIRKPIGPLRHNDKSLAVEDNEKANLLNQ